MLTRGKRLGVVALVLVFFSLPCFAGQYQVVKVVDGDTIDLNYQGKKERIRLLNVDTPESVHPDKTRNSNLGKKASDYTQKRLVGKFVSLEFDGKKRGKYGRLLAYVILDGANFNLELVHQGWSPYYTKYGASTTYHDAFTAAQSHARAKGLNIWDTLPVATETRPPKVLPPPTLANVGLIHGNTRTRKFHAAGCRYFNCSACTRVFSSRDVALDAGYFPCRLCSPQ